MQFQTLKAYAAQVGAVKASKVTGPNGAFIVMLDANNTKVASMPVGKRSQSGSLGEYNVLITDNGAAIATVNNYEETETMTL